MHGKIHLFWYFFVFSECCMLNFLHFCSTSSIFTVSSIVPSVWWFLLSVLRNLSQFFRCVRFHISILNICYYCSACLSGVFHFACEKFQFVYRPDFSYLFVDLRWFLILYISLLLVLYAIFMFCFQILSYVLNRMGHSELYVVINNIVQFELNVQILTCSCVLTAC